MKDRRDDPSINVGEAIYTWLEHVIPEQQAKQHSLINTPQGVTHRVRKKKRGPGTQELINGASKLASRKMRVTGHARQRMLERGITEDDVRRVLQGGFLAGASGHKQRWHARLSPTNRDLGVVVYPTWFGLCRVVTVLLLDGQDEG